MKTIVIAIACFVTTKIATTAVVAATNVVITTTVTISINNNHFIKFINLMFI